MRGLTLAMLDRACRIFLKRAYPEGFHTIPHPNNVYWGPLVDRPLQGLLLPPLCHALSGRDGSLRGYALRLGSALHPHVKLQIVGQEDGTCVFSVDTHDAIVLDPNHPDSQRWAQLQSINRWLKAQIERAWEEDGLLTFNALLRRELARS